MGLSSALREGAVVDCEPSKWVRSGREQL